MSHQVFGGTLIDWRAFILIAFEALEDFACFKSSFKFSSKWAGPDLVPREAPGLDPREFTRPDKDLRALDGFSPSPFVRSFVLSSINLRASACGKCRSHSRTKSRCWDSKSIIFRPQYFTSGDVSMVAASMAGKTRSVVSLVSERARPGPIRSIVSWVKLNILFSVNTSGSGSTYRAVMVRTVTFLDDLCGAKATSIFAPIALVAIDPTTSSRHRSIFSLNC